MLSELNHGNDLDESREVVSQLELSMDDFGKCDRLDTESTGARSTLKTGPNGRDTLNSSQMNSTGRSATKVISLDYSFEDLGTDQDYIDYKQIIKMGFVEITTDEIN
jgi:hypothetical protein